MADLLKIAAVLEAAAVVLDANEAEKTAAVTEQRNTVAKDLASKYAQATGEELPGEVASKLAAGDPAVLSAVQSVVEKTAGAVESLGRSSTRPDTKPQPVTREDRRKAAWDRFGGYLTSNQ